MTCYFSGLKNLFYKACQTVKMKYNALFAINSLMRSFRVQYYSYCLPRIKCYFQKISSIQCCHKRLSLIPLRDLFLKLSTLNFKYFPMFPLMFYLNIAIFKLLNFLKFNIELCSI